MTRTIRPVAGLLLACVLDAIETLGDRLTQTRCPHCGVRRRPSAGHPAPHRIGCPAGLTLGRHASLSGAGA